MFLQKVRQSAYAAIMSQEASPGKPQNSYCYEGFPTFYYKENLDITYTELVSRKAHRVKTFVYIMQEDRPFGIPSHIYVSTCSQGYTDFGFNLEALTTAYTFSKEEAKKQWGIK